jgi:cyanophycinase
MKAPESEVAMRITPLDSKNPKIIEEVRLNQIFSRKTIKLIFLMGLMVSVLSGTALFGYKSYMTGNAADVSTATSFGICMMGGSTDVDAAIQWMISKSGGGDFVIIRCSGSDGYNDYIYTQLGGVDSVQTLVLSKKDSSNSYVNTQIRNAEALFIAGGDQSDYWKNWRGTAIEDSINSLVAKGVPIGGTSAGHAVLGYFLYAALTSKSVVSSEALANPYYRDITLGQDFLLLPRLEQVITDSHFVARDRMGRLVTFLARLLQDGWTSQACGIGVDEMTAVCMEASGVCSIKGSGTAYFLRTPGMPEYCVSGQPLTFSAIPTYKVDSSGAFNIATWTGSGGTAYTLSASAGALTSSNGNIY